MIVSLQNVLNNVSTQEEITAMEPDPYRLRQIKLKLVGMVEGMCKNVLTNEFFGSVNIDQVQVGGPQKPLLGRGDDKETPNWVLRD